MGSQPHWGGSQLLSSWREWPGQLSRNSPRSRWGASVHYRWKSIGRLQCRISLHPTTEIPDPGLGLLDFQPALHRPLHSSLLSKNPPAFNPSTSHHTSEVERAGFMPSHRQNTVDQGGQGSLPRSHGELTDKLEFKCRAPSQGQCFIPTEPST